MRDYHSSDWADQRKGSGLLRGLGKLFAIGLLAGAGYWGYQQFQSSAEQAPAPVPTSVEQPQVIPLQLPDAPGSSAVSSAKAPDKLLAEQPAPAAATEPAALPLALPTTPPATDSLTDAEPSSQSASPLAAAEPATAPSPEPAETPLNWREHRVRPGDSLSKIFDDWGLSANLLYRIINSSEQAKGLTRIMPGETLRVATRNEQFAQLVYQQSAIRSLYIDATADGFDSRLVERELETRTRYAEGNIQSSLFLDGQEAGLSDAKIMELAAVFGWDIDFALDLRKNDRFRVYYEEQYLDGEKFADGPILAAEFINQGTRYQAVRYTDPKGNTDYYAPDGRSKRRAFIRTPIKFARISSRFTLNRFHPVLKKWRSHRGVDYAAPRGTPIKATGNGRVTFRGRKGGYGNVVFIQHGSKYTTVYAHMSKFSRAARKGAKVKQGQIIGYVGSTGLASGPHLHYELRVNGVHRNPLKVKLPAAKPIDPRYKQDFLAKTKVLLAALDTRSKDRRLAASDQPQAGGPLDQ